MFLGRNLSFLSYNNTNETIGFNIIKSLKCLFKSYIRKITYKFLLLRYLYILKFIKSTKSIRTIMKLLKQRFNTNIHPSYNVITKQDHYRLM